MRYLPLLALALAACGPSKQSRCERFAKDGLGMVMGIANGVSVGLGGEGGVDLPEADKQRAKEMAVAECMTWPDDFVRCVTDGDWESDSCREAYAKKEGIVVRADGAPGPKPAVADIDKDSWLECAEGSCLVAGGGLRTLDGQKIAEADLVGAVRVGGKAAWLLSKEGEISLRSEASAETTSLPAPREAPDDPLAHPLATTPGGLVLFDDGRVRRLVAPPCERCFEATSWHLSSDDLSALDQPELHELPDGELLYGSTSRIAVIPRDGEPRFVLRARDELGKPLVVGDDLYVGAGKEAFALDLRQCRSSIGYDPGSLSPPCVKARIALSEVAYARPERLGASVFFLADGRIHQLVDGKKGWVAEVEADAMLALEQGGRRLLFGAVHWTYDHPARLVAIDPDSGKTLMQVDLESERSLLEGSDLERHGDRLLAHVGNHLFSWELPALVSAIP